MPARNFPRRPGTLLPVLLLVLAPLAASAQVLTNNGATLTVQPGALLFVRGGAYQSAGSSFANEGTVQLTGNLTSLGSLSGSGLLRFSGAQDQTLALPAGATLANVEVANSGPLANNRLLLPADLTVTSQFSLITGMVRTAATATLTLPNSATLAGEGPGRYIQGHLKVLRNAVTGPVDFGHGVTLDGTGQNLGAVSITRTAGLATADVSFGQNMASPGKQGIDRIWSIVPTNQPTAPVTLTLNWLADDDHNLASFNPAQLWQQPTAGSAWAAVGAAGNASTRSLTRQVTKLNRFTLSNAANPLPVELTRFTAERQGTNGLLRWATASEKNNAYFSVESSVDGRAFTPIAQVTGHGTSPSSHEYTFTDANLTRYAASSVYYRLRQVDLDGAESFSPVRPVQVPAPLTLAAEAFPNPLRAGAELNLRLRTSAAGPATLWVTDALGRTLLQQVLPLELGTRTIQLPEAAHWPPGVYLLRVQQSGQAPKSLKVLRE